jgi:hypothetical protein
MPQCLGDKSARHVLVLTEKTGLFWGVLAAKSMFLKTKSYFAFEFLRFFAILRDAKRCRAGTTILQDRPKKIVSKSLR